MINNCYYYYIEVNTNKIDKKTKIKIIYFDYGDVELGKIDVRKNNNGFYVISAYSKSDDDKELILKIRKKVYKYYFREIDKIEKNLIELKQKGKKLFKNEIRKDTLKRLSNEKK